MPHSLVHWKWASVSSSTHNRTDHQQCNIIFLTFWWSSFSKIRHISVFPYCLWRDSCCGHHWYHANNKEYNKICIPLKLTLYFIFGFRLFISCTLYICGSFNVIYRFVQYKQQQTRFQFWSCRRFFLFCFFLFFLA